ncbi:Hsp20/alpha crystallin family protein [Solwaraspora sp. WMMB335]|uniref:Hsp20/alpha crystallin family protein n=1 Tax=Solwaraspora sp. WMMB335 TaxID=3404118 RepID=UPI003B944CFE
MAAADRDTCHRADWPTGTALVRHAFGTVARPSAGFVPAAEVSRDGDDAVIRVELPGVGVDERHGRRWREVRHGSFRRSFALPAQVTADAVTASYDAGV